MNDGEAFRKLVIPTIYWHIGNQDDVWVYSDGWLIDSLKEIFAVVYTSAQVKRPGWIIQVDNAIFQVVLIELFSICNADGV